MVRPGVVAAVHRTRLSNAEGQRPSPFTASSTQAIYNGIPGYGTVSPLPDSPHAGLEQDSEAPEVEQQQQHGESSVTILPRSESYHGQIHRADSPVPSQLSASSFSSESIDTEGGELGLMTYSLPSYSSFKLVHYALDLPLTLLTLSLFLVLAVFGWPVPDSPWPHRIHLKQLGLGAITWISTEAIRRRIFRFFGSSRYSILRSTAFLLFVHTLIQETLRLFAISLTFHFGSTSPHPLPPLPPSEPPTFLGLPYAAALTAPRPPKGFFKAFHLALGFAAAETIWQTLALLGQVALYESESKCAHCQDWLHPDSACFSQQMCSAHSTPSLGSLARRTFSHRLLPI